MREWYTSVMIQSHQPKLFNTILVYGLSSVQDGNQSTRRGDTNEATANAARFLKKLGISPSQASMMSVTYDGSDFSRYHELDLREQGAGLMDGHSKIICDALITTSPGHAIMLTLGDCCGAILYAPDKNVLMVSHLGRHSTEIDGAVKSVAYLRDAHDCDVAELIIWLSPAAGKNTYPLHARGGRSLHEELVRQFTCAGVAREHIEVCDVDTATHPDYFSHSQFLKDSTRPDGRFSIVAMLADSAVAAT